MTESKSNDLAFTQNLALRKLLTSMILKPKAIKQNSQIRRKTPHPFSRSRYHWWAWTWQLIWMFTQKTGKQMLAPILLYLMTPLSTPSVENYFSSRVTFTYFCWGQNSCYCPILLSWLSRKKDLMNNNKLSYISIAMFSESLHEEDGLVIRRDDI